MASPYFIGPSGGSGSGLPDQTGNSGKFLTTDGSATSWASAPSASYATQAEQEAASSTSVAVSPGRQQYHPSAPKAWCAFNGTGTVAIAASYNVTSLTDNGTGNYGVNLTTSFSSTSYCVVASCNEPGGASTCANVPGIAGSISASAVPVVTITAGGSTKVDANGVYIVALGDQ